MAIDIGSLATDRNSYQDAVNRSFIVKGNPADGSGIIDVVEIWGNQDMGGVKVGMFYVISGDTLKCRSAYTIGSVASGSKQTFSGLTLAVETNDYLGSYFSSGRWELSTSTSPGLWYALLQDTVVVDNETTYDTGLGYSDSTISLYGIGGVISLLAGVTKDKDGNTKANCECFLCKDNGDNTASFVAYTQSDGSGNYSFTGLVGVDAQYFVISWKDETPHIFDVTDHVLQPVEA